MLSPVIGLRCVRCNGLLDTSGNPPYYCPHCSKEVKGDPEALKEEEEELKREQR